MRSARMFYPQLKDRKFSAGSLSRFRIGTLSALVLCAKVYQATDTKLSRDVALSSSIGPEAEASRQRSSSQIDRRRWPCIVVPSFPFDRILMRWNVTAADRSEAKVCKNFSFHP